MDQLAEWPESEVRLVLCLDLACTESDLEQPGVVVVESRRLEGRRQFPFPPRNFGALSMGRGVVISCDASGLAWARETLGGMTRDEIFSSATIALLDGFLRPQGQSLAGPMVSYLLDGPAPRRSRLPEGVACELLSGEAIQELYDHKGFGNALEYHTDGERPDVLACVGRIRGEIVGIAGVSGDNDTLWQVGVDVLEQHRNRGLGRALVARVTRAVRRAGRIPYYTTGPSNIPSSALAVSVGYRPAWVTMFAR